MAVRLNWTDPNSDEDGFRVYRNEIVFDPIDIYTGSTFAPGVLVDLPADTETYLDTTATEGLTYYYCVSTYKTGVERFSPVLEIFVEAGATGGSTGSGGSPFDPVSLVTADGFYFDTSIGVLWQTEAESTPRTDDNGTVGAVDDLSTYNYSINQSTDGNRPRLQTDNTDLSFDGTADRLRTSYTPSNTAQTLAARFRLNTGATPTKVLIGSASGSNRGWLSVTSGVASMAVGADGSDSHQDDTATDLRSATHYHTAVATWDATEGNLYVDGVLRHTFTRSGGTLTPNNFSIGARHLGSESHDLYWPGDISHVLVTQAVLSPTEVAQLHDAWTPVPDPLAEMVLVAGQSNARSYDTTGSDVPVPLQTVSSQIKIWNTHTQAFEDYEAGVNSDTWNSGAGTPQKWGPEAAFAHDYLAANPTKTLYIVKIGEDSTELDSNAGRDWSPSNTGELFDDMAAEVAAAQAALVAPIPVVALLWMQGEHDGLNSGYAAAYGDNLSAFITAVRAEWGDSSTKVLVGRISATAEWTSGTSVRAFQARVALDTADTFCVDTDGYTLAGDDRHYVAASVQTMGEDMYSAYEETLAHPPVRFGPTTQDTRNTITLSNGNLTAAGTGTTSSNLAVARCDQVPSGKVYWEIEIDGQVGNINLGIGKSVPLTQYWGQVSDSVGYSSSGVTYKNAVSLGSYSSYTTGDVILVAYDSATGKVWFGKNGTWNGDPAAGTGERATISGITQFSSYHRFGVCVSRSGDQMTLVADAASFTYTPPSGFASLLEA